MEKTFKVLNEEGMHARPAGAFVKVANEFKSKVDIKAKGLSKSGKSIIGIMSLGLSHGDEFTVTTSGEDESEALEKLATLIENKFHL